jgi:hypothetical protein
VSDQPAPAEGEKPDAEAPLGPEVFRCRPLSPLQWVAAQGFGILGACVLMPFFLIPFFASWPALFALYLVGEGPDGLKFVVFVVCFLPCYLALFWLVYLQPRGDHLIVHREGFRLKITFKRREVLFRELRVIAFGLESALVRGVMGALRGVRPGQAAMLQEQASAAMNLHYKSGVKTVFKSFLLRFEPEGLQRFLDYLDEQHPELVQQGAD